MPALRLGPGAGKNQHALGSSTLQQLEEDQARLGGLAQAGVVGQHQPGERQVLDAPHVRHSFSNFGDYIRV
jgi:hypothetical protein